MLSLNEQLFLVAINTFLVFAPIYNFTIYLNKTRINNFYSGVLFFLLYVASTVLNLQLNIFALNWFSGIAISVVIIFTILSWIKYICKGRLKWLP